MRSDFNAELHARPSIYFDGPALVEHLALMATGGPSRGPGLLQIEVSELRREQRTQVEYHTEFVTVTRVTLIGEDATVWPSDTLSVEIAEQVAGISKSSLVCRIALLVQSAVSMDLGPILAQFRFGDTAASSIGGGSAVVCSDFRVTGDNASRIILFNSDLNAYRLGRMVRRLCEIETYRAMALLALPEARRLAPNLDQYDAKLVELTSKNAVTHHSHHKETLEKITKLSSHIISASAKTRTRFSATAAYANIVEERISELREVHVPGFQRFGIFIARRFNPAVRTCEATALRLERLSHAAMHLIDLLQTRIQVEIQYQNAEQIQAMAERAATQLKIQRTVEGLSLIAISYYLLGLLKIACESLEHAGYHISPFVMLISVPIVICAVLLAILRVRHGMASPV